MQRRGAANSQAQSHARRLPARWTYVRTLPVACELTDEQTRHGPAFRHVPASSGGTSRTCSGSRAASGPRSVRHLRFLQCARVAHCRSLQMFYKQVVA